jgi:hypothetical protein
MKAASRLHAAIVELLLLAGADSTLVDAKGLSYLAILEQAQQQQQQQQGEVASGDEAMCAVVEDEDEESSGSSRLQLCGFIGTGDMSSSGDKGGCPLVSAYASISASERGAKLDKVPDVDSGPSPSLISPSLTAAATVAVPSGGGLQCCKCGILSLSMSKAGGRFCCIPCTYKA